MTALRGMYFMKVDLSPERSQAIADLLGLFGDATRVRILLALRESELCVSDIAGALGMTASAISHQLRILKAGRLVKSRRDGKTVFYSLADAHVLTILSQAMEHTAEQPENPESIEEGSMAHG